MTGRMVDSYTNIQTLKTFAVDGDEDAYVAESVIEHVSAFRQLMRDLHRELVDAVPAQRGPGDLGVTWLALAAWNAGTMSTAMVATAIPFVLQIMNISGWILEIGSTVFRQIGTARDSMETIAQAADAGRRAGRAGAGRAARRDRVRQGRRSTTGAATRGRVVHGLRPARGAGREDRARRPVGRRQVDAGEPDAADVRRRRRRDPHRRAGHPRRDPGEPAAGDRRGRARTCRCCTARCARTSSTAAAWRQRR